MSPSPTVSILTTEYCTDATASVCSITFLTTIPTPTVSHNVTLRPWLSSVVAVSTSPQYLPATALNNDTRVDTPSCLLPSDSDTLQITFTNNVKTITCWFEKQANAPQPALPTGGMEFPALVYYTPLLQVVLHSSCGFPGQSSCTGRVVVPHGVGVIGVETSATLSNIICNGNTLTMTPIPTVVSRSVVYSPVRVRVNQYGIMVNPGAAPNGSSACSFTLAKHPTLTPFFQLALDADTVIYTLPPMSLQMNNSLVVSHQGDCEDPTSTICTMTYLVPLEQDTRYFRVDMPFFTAPYDAQPVQDETYITPHEMFTKRYTQRFLKSITPQGGVNTLSTTYTTLHFAGALLPDVLQYDVSRFKAQVPLEVVVDEAVCQDPTTPICRVHYRTRYVGRRISLKLMQTPFYGIVDAVNCHGPMSIVGADILMAPLDVDTEHINAIVSPPADVGYSECVVDYAIPFQGSSSEMPVTSVVISAVVEHGAFQVIRLVDYSFPLPDPTTWVFTQLPFTLSYSAAVCAEVQTPTCNFNITISPKHAFFAAATTPEQKDEILRRTFLRQLSLALNQLRTPNTRYGETDFVVVKMFNSGMMQPQWVVNYLDSTLGYHSLQLSFYNDQFTPNDITFDNFFKDDPVNVGEKLDVVINVDYDLYVSEHEEAVMATVNYTLLAYNHIPAAQDNLPVLGSGPVGYTPLYTFATDVAACANENSAICYFRFENMMDNVVFKDITLVSIVVQIPTAQFIDMQPQMSTRDFILGIDLLNERVDENGNLSPYLLYNLTLAPLLHGDQVTLAFVKRMGATGLAKVAIPQSNTKVLIRHPATGQPLTTIWLVKHIDFYYSITEVNYVGDLKFKYSDDCFDRSDVRCTYHLTVATNNLLPGMQLLALPPSDMNSAFFYVEPLGCEGWVGVTKEDSLNHFVREYNFFTGVVTFLTASNTNITLTFDTTERSSAVCGFLAYKLRQAPQYHAPTTPLVAMNVSFFEPPYNIYPYPDNHRTKYIADRRIEYNPFASKFLDDCITSYNDASRCTTQYTSYGTPNHPMVNATASLPQSVLAANPSFSVLFDLGTLLYKRWCNEPPTTTGGTPWSADWPQTDPGPGYGINLDSNLHLWVLAPLYTQRFNASSPMFGTYRLSYDVCDPTAPFEIIVNIAEAYQRTTAVGYYYAELPAIIFPPNLEHTVVDFIPYQMMYNIDPGNAALNAILYQSPDRLTFSPMVLGKLVNMEVEQTIVTKATIAPIIYTFNSQRITMVEIDTTMGAFTTNATWLPCYEYHVNSTMHTDPVGRVVFAWLKTDPITMTSSLQVVHPTTYTKGAQCYLSLPVNLHYPANSYNVLHTTHTQDFSTAFKSYLTYPRYRADAVVHVTDRSAVNSAQSLSACAVFLALVAVLLSSL